MNPEAFASLRTPGAALAFIGSILILVPEIYMVQWYLAWMSILPSLPPEILAIMQALLQLLLVTIAAAIICGSAILAGAIIAATRSGALGGFLALVFGIPAFIVTGSLGWIGAGMAILGGVLALLSGVRPPQKQRSRKSASP